MNINNDYDQNAPKYASFSLEGQGTLFLSFRDLNTLYEKHFQKGQSKATMRCLDYGCGSGRSSRFLKSIGFSKVEGFDVNETMLKQAREADPSGSYSLIPSAKVDVPNETYDIALASFVTVEIASMQEIERIFSEIYRTLVPGGIFINLTLSEELFNPKNDWITYFQKEYPENKNPVSGQKSRFRISTIDMEFSDYYWTAQDIITCAKNSHFSLIEVHLPLGRKEDQIPWQSEWSVSPYSLFVFKK